MFLYRREISLWSGPARGIDQSERCISVTWRGADQWEAAQRCVSVWQQFQTPVEHSHRFSRLLPLQSWPWRVLSFSCKEPANSLSSYWTNIKMLSRPRLTPRTPKLRCCYAWTSGKWLCVSEIILKIIWVRITAARALSPAAAAGVSCMLAFFHVLQTSLIGSGVLKWWNQPAFAFWGVNQRLFVSLSSSVHAKSLFRDVSSSAGGQASLAPTFYILPFSKNYFSLKIIYQNSRQLLRCLRRCHPRSADGCMTDRVAA